MWYRERLGGGNSRIRKIGIVAMARKLLVAWWRYLEEGKVPEGAEIKPACRQQLPAAGEPALA